MPVAGREFAERVHAVTNKIELHAACEMKLSKKGRPRQTRSVPSGEDEDEQIGPDHTFAAAEDCKSETCVRAQKLRSSLFTTRVKRVLERHC